MIRSSFITTKNLNNNLSSFASILTDPQLNLSNLISLPISLIKEPLISLTNALEYENQIFEKLNEEERIWDDKSFQIYTNHYEMIILDDIENLMIAIDEAINNINVFAMSRFIGKGKEKADKLKEALGKISVLVEKWSLCQEKWLHLTKIFINSELKKEMHGIFQVFETFFFFFYFF